MATIDVMKKTQEFLTVLAAGADDEFEFATMLGAVIQAVSKAHQDQSQQNNERCAQEMLKQRSVQMGRTENALVEEYALVFGKPKHEVNATLVMNSIITRPPKKPLPPPVKKRAVK